MSNSTRLLLLRARTFPNGKLDRKNLLSNQASNFFPASQVSTSQFSGRRLSNLNLASRSASPYSTHPTPSSSSIPPPQSLSKDSNKHNSRSLRLLKPKNLSQTDAKIDGIRITPSAVEQIERVRRKDKRPGEVLRLSVESGGCHGFQYKMEFTESIEDDDLLS
ncbi:hypothetical protein BY996DRAFT_6418633 [Phakopsora pachyrhizi]|nr:hypothetical protein BY996DRAFT_6418787 [Phakopsora pachyrhizi]KAI8449290.1 hypothetical protein BY996DRAFT_6418633 [Phakopsora pachyrhizi]